ncbi:MAG: serine hydrolase [Bacteroidota bacterium]
MMREKNIFTYLLFILIFSNSCNNTSTEVVESSLFPTEAWPKSDLESSQISVEGIDSINTKVEQGLYGYIDEVFITQRGEAVYYRKYDNDYKAISQDKEGYLGCGYNVCKDSSQLNEFNYYHPDWHPYYQGRTVHTLQSVTKSVTATIMGIAFKEQKIPSLDDKLINYFSDYKLENTDPLLKEVTIKNLLSMQLGMEWHEMDRPIDSTNTTMQLELSEDWIQFTLDQPFDTLPNTKFVYNSGASHLMSGIIKKTTGEYIDDYARKKLFKPLGIKDFHWKKEPKGFPDTEGGLFLSAQDLAKIGYLYLKNGEWDGQQIISEDWVQQTFTKQVPVGMGDDNMKYGYQWWILDIQNSTAYLGLGFGGQFLIVIPEYEIVATVNSWNIFDDGPFQNILLDILTVLTEG